MLPCQQDAVCVCVCVRACVRACMRACVHVCVALLLTLFISDTIQRGGEVRTTPPISSMDPVTCSSPPVQLQNRDILEVNEIYKNGTKS